MRQVDSQLRSDVLSYVEEFRPPASEPIWSESGEPARAGAQLVFYVTRTKERFGSPGVFWVHALFNFLEDRFASEALAEVATASLCREVTPAEAVDVLHGRMGRPLVDAERATMRLAGERPGLRVLLMLESEALWAGLIQAEDGYVAAFLESRSRQ